MKETQIDAMQSAVKSPTFQQHNLLSERSHTNDCNKLAHELQAYFEAPLL